MELSKLIHIPKRITLRQALRWAEKAWHVFAIIILFGTLLPLMRNIERGAVDQSEGDAFLRTLQIVVYFVSLSILIFYIPKLLQVMIASPWLWAISFWAILSYFWSPFPDLAFRRAIAVLLGSLYGIVLFLRFEFKELLRILYYVFAIIVILSFLVILFVPRLGLMGPPHPGEWRGAFIHKNALARISVMALLLFAFLWEQKKGLSRYFLVFLIGLSLLMVYKANSMSSFLVIIILILSVVMINVARRAKKHWPILVIFLIGLLIFGAFIGLQESEFLLGLIGKDATMTGRIPMWELIIKIAMERPVLGYGYRTFWLGFNGPSALVWENFSWHPAHAHNGYLDVWLQLGLVGVILVSILLFILVRISFTNAWLNENKRIQRISLFVFLYLMFIIFYNITSTLLVQSGMGDAFYWILFSYFYIYLSNEKRFSLNGKTTANSGLSQ